MDTQAFIVRTKLPLSDSAHMTIARIDLMAKDAGKSAMFESVTGMALIAPLV